MTGALPAGWEPRLTAWVDAVERRWRAIGVATSVRALWRRDLVLDLAAARLGGAEVDELVEAEPVAFADDVATAAAPYDTEPVVREPAPPPARPAPSPYRSFVLLAFAGALVGGFVSLVTVYPLGFLLMESFTVSYEQEGVVALLMHAVAGLLAATTGAAFVGWGHRTCGHARRLAVAAGGGLLAAGALAVGPAVAVARSAGYRTDASTMILELLVVVGVCAAVMHGVARLVAVGRT